jgi:hypothetical protein
MSQDPVVLIWSPNGFWLREKTEFSMDINRQLYHCGVDCCAHHRHIQRRLLDFSHRAVDPHWLVSFCTFWLAFSPAAAPVLSHAFKTDRCTLWLRIFYYSFQTFE